MFKNIAIILGVLCLWTIILCILCMLTGTAMASTVMLGKDEFVSEVFCKEGLKFMITVVNIHNEKSAQRSFTVTQMFEYDSTLGSTPMQCPQIGYRVHRKYMDTN
jgi:hypothetical protein